MKKQFDILEQLNKLSKEVNEKVESLRKVIDEEFRRLKAGLLNAYNHESEILYLVQFDSYIITFYKATKKKLHEVVLMWYDADKKQEYKYPHNFNEAEETLNTYRNPSNCEIRSYQTFGYFDDIKRDWNRIDWISEHVQERKFLYEIEEKDFTNAVQRVAEYYGFKNEATTN